MPCQLITISPGGLDVRMQTVIENMLEGARSTDQSTNSDDLHITRLDADPARSVRLGQLKNDMQSNQWQSTFILTMSAKLVSLVLFRVNYQLSVSTNMMLCSACRLTWGD